MIDTMRLEKPYSDENRTVAWYYAYTSEMGVKGVDVLCLMCHVNNIMSLPVAFTLRKVG